MGKIVRCQHSIYSESADSIERKLLLVQNIWKHEKRAYTEVLSYAGGFRIEKLAFGGGGWRKEKKNKQRNADSRNNPAECTLCK